MYSKTILKRYISERIKQMDSNYHQLAIELGITQSNLSRALESEQHNLTLPQFGKLVVILELSPEQVSHILTGKFKKEAVNQLVASAAESLVQSLLTEKPVKKGAKQ